MPLEASQSYPAKDVLFEDNGQRLLLLHTKYSLRLRMMVDGWSYTSEKIPQWQIGNEVKRYERLLKQLGLLRQGGWELRGYSVISAISQHPVAHINSIRQLRRLPYAVSQFGSTPDQSLKRCDAPGFASIMSDPANYGVLAVEGDCFLVARDQPGRRQLRAIVRYQEDGSFLRLHSAVTKRKEQISCDPRWRRLLVADSALAKHGYSFQKIEGNPWAYQLVMPDGQLWDRSKRVFCTRPEPDTMLLRDWLIAADKAVLWLLQAFPRNAPRADPERDALWRIAVEMLAEDTPAEEVTAVVRQAALRPETSLERRVIAVLQIRGHAPPLLSAR